MNFFRSVSTKPNSRLEEPIIDHVMTIKLSILQADVHLVFELDESNYTTRLDVDAIHWQLRLLDTNLATIDTISQMMSWTVFMS